MKSLKFFGIVFMMALFACNASDDNYEIMDAALQKAETIYQNPDGERYETAKADTLQLSSDLMKAAGYFVSKNDYENAAKAFLFCGYCHKEANEKALAMKTFKDAEHFANIADDSLTTARAKYNVAKFLYDEHSYGESIDMAMNSAKYYGNHFDDKAYAYNLIASSFLMQKDYNNAEKYLKKALEHAEKSHSNRAKRKVLNNYSVFYCEQQMYDEAIKCLLQTKNEMDSTNVLFNLNIGILHVYNNDYDSAYHYLKEALALSQLYETAPETSVSIYFFISYITEKQGLYKESLDYQKQYALLQYQTQKENEQKNLYNIQRKYNYEALQNKMNQKIIQKQRIILTVSFLLLLASMMVIGLLVQQKKILKEDERIRKELEKAKDELQNSVNPQVVEKELSRHLHLILTANHIAEHADDFKKEWSPLVYKINNEKDTMFEAALVAIESVYPGMYDTILKKYPTLNETGSKVMLLSCSDLTNREIGQILGLSVHTINKCRSEINRVI